jgi:cytochrome c
MGAMREKPLQGAARRQPVWRTCGGRQALLAWLLLACSLGVGCNRYEEITRDLSPADRARFDRGKRLAGPCWVCHDITGKSVKVGPHLVGIFGREVGSLPNSGYSEEFARSQGRWNWRELDRYLASPQGFSPKTTMISPGMPSPRNRSDLLFFLEHVTKEP